MDNKSLKSYDESVNLFIKHPWIFIPFLFGYLISVFILPVTMLFIGGNEAYDYWYNSKIFIASPSVQASVLIALFATVIISAFIIGFFDAVGISGISEAVKKGDAFSLKQSWINGFKLWISMIITSLTLVIIGFIFVYPILLMISVGTDAVFYLAYALIAAMFYASLLFYARIATVVDGKSGLGAIIKGIKLFYKNLPFNIINSAIIIIIYLAFSWVFLLSPAIHLLVIAILLIPWINIFLTIAYFKINPEITTVSEEVVMPEVQASVPSITVIEPVIPVKKAVSHKRKSKHVKKSKSRVSKKKRSKSRK